MNHWKTITDNPNMRSEKELKSYLLELLDEENTIRAELHVFLKDNKFYSERFSWIINRLRLIKGIRVGLLYAMNKEELSDD